MRKRNIGKFIRLNEEENRILKENATKVGKTESGYIRNLILGYKPKEQPTDALDMIDVPYYKSVYEKICKLEKRLNEELFENRK